MPCNLHRWMSEMRISIQTLALELPWYLFLPSLGASILKLVRGDMISWRDPMGPVSLTREESSLQLSKCSLLGPHWTVFILSKVSAERPLTLGNSHSLLPEKPTVFTSDYFMSWESYEINDCNVYIIIFFYTSTWFQSQVPILPVEKNYLSQFRLILVTGSLVNSGIYFPPLFFSGLDLNFGGVGSREQLIFSPLHIYVCILVSVGPSWCYCSLPWLPAEVTVSGSLPHLLHSCQRGKTFYKSIFSTGFHLEHTEVGEFSEASPGSTLDKYSLCVLNLWETFIG